MVVGVRTNRNIGKVEWFSDGALVISVSWIGFDSLCGTVRFDYVARVPTKLLFLILCYLHDLNASVDTDCLL